ncbi:MAG: HlyD family efflux transporter periplasmic adaptor subunit [Planctomycetota bacterium]
MTESTLGRADVSRASALRAAQTPAWFWRLAQILGLGLLLLPPAFMLLPWRQNVRGDGRVVAYAPLERQQAVEAPIDGRVTEWWVVEGSQVTAGQLLFEISDNDPNLLTRLSEQRSAYEAKLAAADAKLAAYAEKITAKEQGLELELEVAQQKILMAGQRVTAAERAVDAAEIAAQTAELNYERRSQLKASGLVSEREFELARLELREAELQLAREQASLEAARSDRAALEAARGSKAAEYTADIRSARAQREEAASEAASARSVLAEIDVKIARQANQRVTAPVSGTVLRLNANRGGEMVKAGDPVAVLVPDTTSLAVELWVDGNDMPLIAAGRPVRLQFEGWPAVQFAGWPSVAVGTFGGVVQFVDASDDGSGRFRLVVTPDDPGSWPTGAYLRQGVRTRGWVLLEEVSLGFEFWRQINGFPPVVAPSEPKQKAKIKVGK